MRRREFLVAVGGAALWPVVAHAQQQPVLGFLSSGSSNARQDQVSMLFRGLADGGFEEGKNLSVIYRWANDRYDRLPALAAELVALRVSVIAATGGPVSALAAKGATSTIPIVFTGVSDPQRFGLVSSFNRPGGNITGTGGFVDELDAKRLELLREIIPAAKRLGALYNANRPGVDAQIDGLTNEARKAGLQLVVFKIGTEAELDAAVGGLNRSAVDALLVTADPYFNSYRERLVALLASHRVPAIYQWSSFATAGGLMSYGPSIDEAYEKAGTYVARILKGEKAGDLPILQPSNFELTINLTTANALGLTVPPTLLARADQVIE